MTCSQHDKFISDWKKVTTSFEKENLFHVIHNILPILRQFRAFGVHHGYIKIFNKKLRICCLFYINHRSYARKVRSCEKNSCLNGTRTNGHLYTLRCRCFALPTELWSQLGAAHFLMHNLKKKYIVALLSNFPKVIVFSSLDQFIITRNPTGGPDVVCDLHTWQYCATFWAI